MATALRELLAYFDISVNSEELKDGHKHVESFLETLKSGAKTVAEGLGIAAFYEFTKATIEAGSHAKAMSERLGVTTDVLQGFQFAASTVGVDAESAAYSLGLFNRQIGEAAKGTGRGGQAFAGLGIHLRDANGQIRPMTDILADVADKMQALPEGPQRAALAMRLFGRSGQQMIPLLSQGSKGIAALTKEFGELGGGMSKDFIEKADKADVEFAKLRVASRTLRSSLVGEMLPAIIAGTSWLKEKAKAVIGLTRTSYVLRTMLQSVAVITAVRLIPALIRLGRTLGFLKEGALGLLKSFAGFGFAIAIATALYYAWDDIYTLFQGGDSVLGDLLDQMNGLGGKEKFVNDMKEAWQGLKDVLSGIGPIVSEIARAIIKEIPDAARVLVGTVITLKGLVKGGQEMLDAYRLAGQATYQAVTGDTDAAKKNILDFNAKWAAEGAAIMDEYGRLVGADYAARVNQNPEVARQQGVGTRIPTTASLPDIATTGVGTRASAGAVIVTQTNHTEVTVTTQPGADHRSIGKATGQGVADANQKQLSNALNAANGR